MSVMGPPRILVYGEPGAGKTMIARAAEARLINIENGAHNIPGYTETPWLRTWPEIADAIAACDGSEPVAIDSLDWLVSRACEHVCLDLDPKSTGATNTLGSAFGGFFKAREIVANVINRDVVEELNRVNQTAPILLLAHAGHEKIMTPEGVEMRACAPRLPQWIGATFCEWVDAVLYARLTREGRELVCVGRGNIVAKNRYGLPEKIEFDRCDGWNEIVSRIQEPALPW